VVQVESLRVIDYLWMEHLDTMKSLGEGVGLRGYAQKDPLVEYKKEGHVLFEKLTQNIYFTVADRLSKVEIRSRAEIPKQEEPKRGLEFQHGELEVGVKDEVSQAKKPIKTEEKVGRNDPCPCGSGKKYKKCHG